MTSDILPHIIGIIPARYASTRLPGKPLALIAGRPMIEHVYRRAQEALSEVYVATDHKLVADAVRSFGGRVIMTSPLLRSGTERCEAAVSQSAISADAIVNIQGDEPLIDPDDIRLVCRMLREDPEAIATLARVYDPQTDGFGALESKSHVKVVTDLRMNVMYFSRAVIPFVRDKSDGPAPRYLLHSGIYGFTTEMLRSIARLAPSPLEQAENLEQLRWMEHGMRIRVGLTPNRSIPVDTPDDIALVEERLKQMQ